MAKFGGKGHVTLFSVQGSVEKQLRLMTIDRICQQLGFTKPEKKTVAGYDLPVVPVEGDFFHFPFRLLSKTIVGSGSYKSTNFSQGSVLHDSVNLIQGIPAYLNHEQVAGREIGFMGEASWEEGYQLHGEKIPAGIGGDFILDKNLQGAASMPSNADLIRRLSGPVPLIKACSMSVYFEWESSHDFEREYDFWMHVGEMIDGKEVTRDVTKVVDYGEGSLCYQGADPFARKKNDKGKILYAKYIDEKYNEKDIFEDEAFAKMKFSADNIDTVNNRYFVCDGLSKNELLNLSKATEHTPNNKNDFQMDELLMFLAAQYGITAEEIKNGKFSKANAEKFKIVKSEDFAKLKTEADYNAIVAEKTTLTAEVATLKAAKETAEASLAALNTEKTNLTSMAKIGTTVLTLSREEAKRVYGIFTKGKPDATITKELDEEQDFTKLEAKIKLFGGQAINDFGGHCSECGSKEITFRQSTELEDLSKKKKEDKSNTKSRISDMASRL